MTEQSPPRESRQQQELEAINSIFSVLNGLEEETRIRHRSKRLVVFNHKGGVGKTTLTVNIASALADAQKKVLLVDSDPQCNLSSYLVEASVLDDVLDRSETDTGQTLWSALRPIVEASGDVRPIDAVERFPNVFLLYGDLKLADFEQELPQMWLEALQRKLKGCRETPEPQRLVTLDHRKIQLLAQHLRYIGPRHRFRLSANPAHTRVDFVSRVAFFSEEFFRPDIKRLSLRPIENPAHTDSTRCHVGTHATRTSPNQYS